MNTFLLKSGRQGNELTEDNNAYFLNKKISHPSAITLSIGQIAQATILSPLPSALPHKSLCKAQGP